MVGKQKLRLSGKRGLRRVFEIGQRAGVDILPRHFYSSIPAIAELRMETDWRRAHDMDAIIGSDLEAQLAFARTCCPASVINRMPRAVYQDACVENGAVGFGEVEAQFLYGFVATRRPRQVLQIGCGVSTAVILRASRDVGHAPKLTCVEPYPTQFLLECAASGRIELMREKAQQVAFERLRSLDEGDLLFVDSTHTVKPGSEVNRIVLEVLPRLRANVYVHFHDIVFPYDYYPTILQTDLFFWNESVLLQAFLTQNTNYALRAALSMVHHSRPEVLNDLLPGYRPARCENGLMLEPAGHAHFPSSAYLQVLGS